ncbi:MAG TPA: tRNA pseudouridine(55) synthase TruB [Dehalococcoidia bacterium]|nr:tRNA pseudouridine(55) synthase TruB [Dehalococcoidia bacterium]
MSSPHGFLIVDKPSGVTSFAMVALVRRLTGVRRVGHAGTLDPLASGVLPVAVGQATRFIEYLDDAPKAYVARVRFGWATDTYDADGQPTGHGDPSRLDAAAVAGALPAFAGDIEQTPPAFSAIKIAGKPLYRYAREGAAVAAPPRTVRIDRIVLRSFEPPVAEIAVTCGKGTYIRSLAHDLGRRLGCPAHLAALQRTATGGFAISDAHAPSHLEAAARDARLPDLLLAVDRAVERRPAAILGPARCADVRAGRNVVLPPRDRAQLCRAYSSEGDFLGVLRCREGGGWHPEKVLGAA